MALVTFILWICLCLNYSVIDVGFAMSTYTFVEGTRAEVEVAKSGPFAFDIPFRIYAEGLTDKSMSFDGGPNSPSSISLSFRVSDDDITIEPDEYYTLTLQLLEHNSQVNLTNNLADVIISDDDSEFCV